MLEALGQSTVTWCILLVGLLFLVLHLTWGYLTYTKSRDPACMAPLPPGNVGWPLVGETFSFLYTVRHVDQCLKKAKILHRILESHNFA